MVANKTKAKNSAVKDNKQSGNAGFPFADVLLFIIHSSFFSTSSARTLALDWNKNKRDMGMSFDGVPERISYDTLRSFISFLGRFRAFELFMTPVTEAMTRMYGDQHDPKLDAELKALKKKFPCVLHCPDTADGFTVRQLFDGDKKNKPASRCTYLLENLDLSGCVVCANIFNPQRKFAEFLGKKGCDFCLGLKGSQKNLESRIGGLSGYPEEAEGMARHLGFSHWFCEHDETFDLGVCRVERNTLVIPGTLLLGNDPQSGLMEDWPGLVEGCIAAVTDKTVLAKTGRTALTVRYFASSLHYDENYIAKRIAELVKAHFSEDHGPLWEFDLTIPEDRSRCTNSDYLQGQGNLFEVIKLVASLVKDPSLADDPEGLLDEWNPQFLMGMH